MRNKIEDLRNQLFETLEKLNDDDAPMDLNRARTIAEVAQVIVNSAKIEVDYIKATKRNTGTGFIPIDDSQEPETKAIDTPNHIDWSKVG